MIYLAGYSTRSIESFLEMLRKNDITLLGDIRTIPRSGSRPEFEQKNLSETLARHGIRYLHLKGLGGLRKPRKDSENAWKNDSFRGFADYMETEGFEAELDAMIDLGRTENIVLMCAEGNPYRCHRSLIGDALAARGLEVLHLPSKRVHRITSFARVNDRKVSYPA